LVASGLLLVTSLPAWAGDAALKHGGVYRGKTQGNAAEPNWAYLRFYEDGTVISVTSTGQPEELKKWFQAGHPGVSKGTVKQEGDAISFTTKSEVGEVEYQGKIKGETLKLEIHSRINDHKSKDEFKFISW
jgi:hypothetical protein